MSHHSIDVRDLHFAYPDGTPALRGASFSIGHGESVAIVGPNGAGKSTLLLHLVGLNHPRSGVVDIGGVPVVKETLADVRRSVGMVFQDADDQLFMPTVADDVAFGPVNLGLPADIVEERVTEALSRVGALALRDRPPHRLSGGEKRVVSIATVLAMCPNVLVMDEPSSNLDPRARRRLIELLATFEHTRIIATHDLDMALELCERTIVMKEGVVRADGPTRELFSDAAMLEECGLEQPAAMRPCSVCGASAGIIAP